MYRFFKHNNDWRFIEKGSEKSEAVGTFALEGVLGVTGTRKATVQCKQPDGRNFGVTVDNGFITKVEYLYEENAYHDVENERYPYIATKSAEQTEFFAEQC